MWWRFRKHKLALVAAVVVVAASTWWSLFADFLAYADPNASEAQRSLIAAAARSTGSTTGASARTSTA